MNWWCSLFLNQLSLWLEHRYINIFAFEATILSFFVLNLWLFWIYYREHVYNFLLNWYISYIYV
ncbi:hypothetical protein GIB67_024437, partial [Kingdonia uniflora]